MKLFLANVSRQKQIATYRMDIDEEGNFSERLRGRGALFETVDRGKQVCVANRDWHPKQAQAIIDQLSVYGLVEAKDVATHRGVVDLVYSRDFPTPTRVLENFRDQNFEIKIDEGTVRREKAAIAAHEILSQRTGEVPDNLAVEFEQEEVSEMGESSIAEGFNVMTKTPDNVAKRKVG